MGMIELGKPSLVEFYPDQSLAKAVDIMISNELGSAPVVNNENLVGILNLASALKRTREGENPQLKVRDVMLAEIDKRNHDQALLDSLVNGIITIDVFGIIHSLNKAAHNLLGVGQEVIGRPIKEVFPKSYLPAIAESGITQYSQKLEINGRTIVSNRSPIICNNEITGAVAVFQDITDLENISNQLTSVQQLNRELDAIINSSYDGVMITDSQGRGIRINRAMERITGLDSSHFEGKYIADLFKNGIFLCESITVKALREKRTVTSIQKMNSGKHLLVTGNPVIDPDGKVVRVVTNVRDVTELNQLKEEVEESKLLATRYQTELSQLILERLKKEKIIVESLGMRKLFNLAVRAARTDATVLILGESGVGKDVLARVIHNTSNRANTGSFIEINCGAIPENLLESELFGYEPGAFTGASPKGKPGMFEIANHGTLLLDEIGDLPLNLQVKLLRVLQGQEVYRIGGTKPTKLDVRIIAATNRNVWERVKEGTFREDLYYRLNVFPIEVPPLRERKEDILPLALHFIQQYNEKYGLEKRLDPKAIPVMEEYTWPGNIRELQNVLERLLVITDEELIHVSRVQGQLTKSGTGVGSPITVNELVPIPEAKEMLEKELIRMAFDRCPSIRKAAKVLGLGHSNVLNKAARYGIKM